LDQLVSYGTVSSSSTFAEKLPQTIIIFSTNEGPEFIQNLHSIYIKNLQTLEITREKLNTCITEHVYLN
jgi:hypothetical protein